MSGESVSFSYEEKVLRRRSYRRHGFDFTAASAAEQEEQSGYREGESDQELGRHGEGREFALHSLIEHCYPPNTRIKPGMSLTTNPARGTHSNFKFH